MSVPARPVALSLFVSLRPAQWTKNLIVFAALLLRPARRPRRRSSIRTAIAQAIGAFVDLLRAVGRRLSDQRRRRSRERSAASAEAASADRVGRGVARRWRSARRCVLAVAALGARLRCCGRRSRSSRVAYVALLALYSGPLKHVVIIDVLTIAIGFVLRAAGGRGRDRRADQPLAADPDHPARAVPRAEQAAARAGPARRRRDQPSADPRGIQPVPARPDDRASSPRRRWSPTSSTPSARRRCRSSTPTISG